MDNEQIVATEATAAPEQTEVRETREPREQRDGAKVPFRNKRRKKVCAFCADKVDYIDYKDTARIRKNLSERAKILPRSREWALSHFREGVHICRRMQAVGCGSRRFPEDGSGFRIYCCGVVGFHYRCAHAYG